MLTRFVCTAVLAQRLLVIGRLTYKQDDTLGVMQLLVAGA